MISKQIKTEEISSSDEFYKQNYWSKTSVGKVMNEDNYYRVYINMENENIIELLHRANLSTSQNLNPVASDIIKKEYKFWVAEQLVINKLQSEEYINEMKSKNSGIKDQIEEIEEKVFNYGISESVSLNISKRFDQLIRLVPVKLNIKSLSISDKLN